MIKNINKNLKDEDCDIMSNYNVNEYLYIIKKCFEAKKISINDIEMKILTPDNFYLLLNKDNYNLFILTISSCLSNMLNIVKPKEQMDTLSFVKTFFYNNYIFNKCTIDEFQKLFLDFFPDIIFYNEESDELYMKKLAGYFKDKIDMFEKKLELYDLNKKGFISFIGFEKIIDIMKINLKKDILEYLIYFMKKECINNKISQSIKDLNYKALIDKIREYIEYENIDLDNLVENNNNEKDKVDNDSEKLFNIKEDTSYIELTNEEYNEKIMSIINSIKNELFKKNSSQPRNYMDKIFNKYIITDDDNHKIIELSKLIEEIKNSFNIELNQIEIFCLYSKYKINEENNNCELIDYEYFINDITNRSNYMKENYGLIKKEELKKKDEKSNKKKEEESLMIEYNDFEKQKLDNDDDSINGLEKIITDEGKE
jgi:hypothetical protein